MEDNFQGVKVMVIDDSKTIRRTAETLLAKAGCEVVTAVDGFDALAKIADTQPSIIFVDIIALFLKFILEIYHVPSIIVYSQRYLSILVIQIIYFL